MSDKIQAKELIDQLRSASGKPLDESFALSEKVTAEKNKIKSGDHCLNLIGSNLVVYSTDNEKQKAERREILSLLEQLLDNAAFQNETAEKTHTALLCAMETQRAMLSDLGSEIFHKLSALKQESLLNARANLHAVMNEMWQGKRDPNYAKSITDCCRQIKGLCRDDLVANFCERAFAESPNPNAVRQFLTDHYASCSDEELDFVLRTILLNYDRKYDLAIEQWIEQLDNRGNQRLHNYYRARYDDKKRKMQSGVYDCTLPRKIFIAYSNEDIAEVIKLKDELESDTRMRLGNNQIFVAAVNLQQCNGAAYQKAIHSAIDHSTVFLFVSTEHSRGPGGAYDEIDYVMQKDRERAGSQWLEYKRISRRYKHPRVEYRIGAYYDGSVAYDRKADEFIKQSGIDTCTDVTALKNRLYDLLYENAWEREYAESEPLAAPAAPSAAPVPAPAVSGSEEAAPAAKAPLRKEKPAQKPKKKYCADCLGECDADATFCPQCGKANLLGSYEEAKAANDEARLEKESKYCVHCLTRNSNKATFCKSCGEVEFRTTKADAENKKAQLEKALKKQLESWFTTGMDYYLGRNGRTENDAKAVEYFVKAAEKGLADAQYMLGECCYAGDGVDKDLDKAAEWYAKAAEQEHADAQYSLGWCYYHGEGVTEDLVKAAEWYAKAAAQGNDDAEYSLGLCYQAGEGVKEDHVKAVELFRKAADHGNADAQYMLGLCYQSGDGVTKDEKQAARLYAKAAEQEHADAQFELGRCYYYGFGIKEDHAKGMVLFTRAAENDHAEAQYALGRCYYYGRSVKRNPAKAAALFAGAARQGIDDARYLLGRCYFEGAGVKKNQAKAAALFAKLAEQDHAWAQLSLGECYLAGKGVKKDLAKAIALLTKAEEKGNPVAQFELGKCYYEGRGVPEDLSEAVDRFEDVLTYLSNVVEDGFWGPDDDECVDDEITDPKARAKWCAVTSKWFSKAIKSFTKAADQGNADAQSFLGYCYYEGIVVNKDNAKAAEWYAKAAEQGHADAQFTLGYCNLVGNGVTKDLAKAAEWYAKAAEQGHAAAQFELGWCYYKGIGTAKDLTKAMEYFTKAVNNPRLTQVSKEVAEYAIQRIKKQ